MSETILLLWVATGLTSHGIFLRLLRNRVPGDWEALGKPSLIMNNSISNGLKTQRYLFSRKVLQIDDPTTRRLGAFTHWFSFAYIVCIVAYVAYVVLGPAP